ncbi:tRNase Z TRZ3, mitochondrial-like [Chenopodium quinoa]|uniref:tRNase Z TRZ3, mitochondrial-like n=1 Tax=Chenopodium quinoa TaxID=63459 RepID=UPI000B788403|nr:tRNase Z TRZ3, mitochondrial-like [Chenopodium quinoa]
MSQITTLRLLINHSPPIFSPLFFKPRNLHLPIRRFSLLTAFSSLPKKKTNFQSSPEKPLKYKSRNKSSLPEQKKGEEGAKMAETESSGFNKRRAMGKDKDDKPKNLQLKVRKLNPVNTICYVQILGTGMDTQDTSPSVLLFFDKQRFIFNAGEGLQRYCTEHRIKLSKIDHIFLSRVCSETAGGLPGLLLTLAGIGEEGICVNMWGPSNLRQLVAAMKAFIPNAAMVHTRSFGPLQDPDKAVSDLSKFSGPILLINDEVVKLSAILLQPNEDKESINNESETTIKPRDLSVVYICDLPEIQGKFDPEKAKALGLRAGPKYRELQQGKSVKSDHRDIMVHPSDVMEPPIPGPIVLLVDCPTASHLQNLLSVDSLNKFYTDFSGNLSENTRAVACVIHLSPSSVASNPAYQNWMKRFGDAQHIMAGHERKNVEIPVLKSSAKIAARLNYLCPRFFPAPGFWSLDTDNILSNSTFSTKDPQTTIAAENLLKFTLRPYANLGLDRSSVPTYTGPAQVLDDLRAEIPEIDNTVQQVRQLWDSPVEVNGEISLENNNSVVEEPWFDELGLPSCLQDITREDMEIVLLGTGSSQPSKYRNVSSIFINLFSKGSLLFDCGEGTLGQLKRRFGIEGADNAVRNLRCIWISHIHADHHTGLARILALRRDLLKGVPHEPLLVVGPGQLMRFLNAYQKLEELDMQFLDCRHTTQASWDAFASSLNSDLGSSSPTNSGSNVDSTLFIKGSPMQSYWKRPSSPVGNADSMERLSHLRKVLQDAGLETLISFPVVHCPQAFGTVLKAGDRINNVGEVIPGWKVVYSGDTRPCQELIEASHGATVLIHEATFEDALMDEAVARNHSTTKEAIEVGEAAGVYRIILTHFSQRYPKIPVFEDAHMHNTCIGFDMMSINMADLPVLPRILPHLRLLFRTEMGVDEADDLLPEAVSAAS